MLRSALVGLQEEQGGLPRRTSLPSISALTSQENPDPERDQQPWRRASTSNTVAEKPLLSLHDSQGGIMSSDMRDFKLPVVHAPGPTASHILPTRPGPLDRKLSDMNAPEKPEGPLYSLQPSRIPPDDAPSAPPPSPATQGIEMRGSGDLDAGLASLTPTNIQTKIEMKKFPGRDAIAQWPSPRVESDRKRYKCPFEGCGRQYTWKENLTRHHTT